jgi:hypothetical protein
MMLKLSVFVVKDRKELIEKNDGGVLIMVRPDIKSDECPDLDTECEIKWIEIRPTGVFPCQLLFQVMNLI